MRFRSSTFNYFLSLVILIFMCRCSSNTTENKKEQIRILTGAAPENPTKKMWGPPDTTTIQDDEQGELIKYGKELVVNTSAFLGTKGTVAHLSNGMNCQNCHLNAGTKLYANSFSAVHSVYPKFRARSGTVENLEKRINDCMERSLNGKKLADTSKEMRAMVAYINWVGKDVKKGEVPEGASVIDLPYLERASDPKKGKIAFEVNCVSCHNKNGDGKLNDDSTGYVYPPLWGANSYNVSAGMYRLSRLAGFIKSNMPYLKSSFDNPILTDEEAWDIAAYISTMPRPEKRFSKDWPDISKKPIDHPFGPYSDKFSESRHKFGPYKELQQSAFKK